jgi:hypothetical protein
MAALSNSCRKERVSVDDVRRQLTDHVVLGDTPNQVTASLAALHLDHSEYDRKHRTIRGIIRNSSESFLITGNIQYVLYFDEKDRLSRIVVREVYTGP